MKVKNVSDGIRYIADSGDEVEPDGVVTVNQTLGESLCEQSDVWQEAKTKKADEAGDD